MPSKPALLHPAIKLKPRLRLLFGLIQAQADNYDTVWDCCCDHGYLGMKLLRKKICAQVQFVDCVEHLMEDLRQRLSSFSPGTYNVLCDDAGNIAPNETHRHLIVLAGIGGELAVTIIDSIIARHPHHCLSFLLCPNTAQYYLRAYLIEKKFLLIKEDFLREKRWNYEILLVTRNLQPATNLPNTDLAPTHSTNLSTISPIGELWQADDDHHLAYLSKMQQHYSDQAKNCQTGRAQTIADAYRACLTKLNASR